MGAAPVIRVLKNSLAERGNVVVIWIGLFVVCYLRPGENQFASSDKNLIRTNRISSIVMSSSLSSL
jgi:hypothetical protein